MRNILFRTAVFGLAIWFSVPVVVSARQDTLNLIPRPLKVQTGTGSFNLRNAKISVSAPDSIRDGLTDFLPSIMRNHENEHGSAPFEIHISGHIHENQSESYVLDVTEKRISIQAGGPAGAFYALQTLSQLTDTVSWTIPAVHIEDKPRFAYRGVMLDVSRHFFDADFIRKQIDALARYKINRLHLHLTDAAGWRLESDRYPRLTNMAAWRPQKLWKDWWKGNRRYIMEGAPGAYGGYYTKEDIRQLVRYAAQRHITIIPEIEMPSHSEEVLTAYPELSCTHEFYKASDFCVGNEKTFEFLENILSEVMELFPSEYIHIGGDEAPMTAWRQCSLCRKRMEDENLKDVRGLQSYLIHRIERFLNSHGRKLLGWDEILEGGLAPNATVMSWRGQNGGIKAVKSGHKAIMTPGEYCYLDGYQDAPYTQPEAIGGYLPLQKVYQYDPIPDSLSGRERKLIEGVQANLWTEYVPTEEHCEYMLYPRVLALAEIAWTQPERKDWKHFHKRALHAVRQLQESGYHAFPLEKEFGNRPEAGHMVKHLAWGRQVTYQAPYWSAYPAGGATALTDGIRGGWNYNDGCWQGFVSRNRLDAVIDLEAEKEIHHIAADFMQICGPEVFLPEKVIISASADGKTYHILKEISHRVERNDEVTFKTYRWQGKTRARYIRYQALAGEQYGGVIFTDEIIIE